MAVIQENSWWVYVVNSMEIGTFDSESVANAVAEANVTEGFPVMVVPVQVFREED